MTITETWQARMKKAKHKFAMIRTKTAIFDRVAIVRDLPSLLVVQFPKGKISRASVLARTVSITQENISKRDVEDLRYYKD
jgi:hypothetical protein